MVPSAPPRTKRRAFPDPPASHRRSAETSVGGKTDQWDSPRFLVWLAALGYSPSLNSLLIRDRRISTAHSFSLLHLEGFDLFGAAQISIKCIAKGEAPVLTSF